MITFSVSFPLGLQKFLDEIAARDDTYFVTNQQLLDWMQDPKTLTQLKNRATAGAFSCKEDKVVKPDVLPGENCNVFHLLLTNS